MNLRIKEKCANDLSNVTQTLKLVNAKDKSGVNVACEILNHSNANKNKTFYLLRLLNDGTITLFKNNKDIGFKTDDNGTIKINLRDLNEYA